MGKGRAPCCDRSKVRTGPWCPAEDLRLIDFILKNGHTNWRALPAQAGLLRCGKSCRLRWVNYLRPDVKRGNITPEEEETIIKLHNSIGKKWSKIASYLPGRTDNEIKNIWNTHLKKKLTKIGEDGHKTEGENSKMDFSAASSSTTTSGNENKDFLFSSVQKPDKNLDSMKLISIHPSREHINDPEQTPVSNDSPLLESEATNYPRGGFLDNGKFEIPPDLDVDFWELLDSLEPLPCNKTAEINGGEQEIHISIDSANFEAESETAVSKCLRFLEKELGLTSECDAVDQHWVTTSTPHCHQMNFEPQISPAFDYSSIWPCSP